GGETVAADRMRDALTDSAALDAERVEPLRERAGPGIRLVAPHLRGADMALDLPWAKLFIAPLPPTRLHLSLPQEMRLTLQGRSLDFAADTAGAILGLSPLRRIAMDDAHLSATGLRLDGTGLARLVEGTMSLQPLGHDAPRMAGAAYDMSLRARDMQPEAMDLLGFPGLPAAVSGDARGRLWFDDAIFPQSGQMPRLVGLQTDQAELRIGDLTLRLATHVVADEAGRATGRVALYTRDADALLDQLVAVGIVPTQALPPLRLGLAGLGRAQLSPAEGQPDLPQPKPDELRLTLEFRDGQTFLGPVGLGAAPLFPR
ncbi:MAG: DUF2125 domain-containing protein, partial [Paracoccus sp. (in: a-proteobacteria)]|nr:DUF2125 domain-containing protein [Paracoccus sp. (in: a-proteobacteria)]